MENRDSLVNNVYDHMIAIYVPEFIREEFLEQQIFYSVDYLRELLSWTIYQFENWYDSHSDYCMSNY